MSAHEFGLHLAVEEDEALSPPMNLLLGKLLAATTNGPLKAPPGGLWQPEHFVHLRPVHTELPAAAQPVEAAPRTVDEIMARVRAAGG